MIFIEYLYNYNQVLVNNEFYISCHKERTISLSPTLLIGSKLFTLHFHEAALPLCDFGNFTKYPKQF